MFCKEENMIRSVGGSPEMPGSSNVSKGGRAPKPSQEVKASSRSVNESLDGSTEGVQRSMSRKELLSASGELVRKGTGTVKNTVTDSPAGTKAVLKHTQKAAAGALKHIAAFSKLSGG
jgi:hypothetical protein